MTQKYNSRDAEVEPRTDEPEYGVINFRRVKLYKKGDQVEAAMHEDNKEEGSNGMEV